MKNYGRYEYITEKATNTCKSWTNAQKVNFHFFNKNGLYAKWIAMCITVEQYVTAGIVPSGWFLAYGSLSNFSAKELAGLAGKNRVNSIELQTILGMLRDDITTGYSKLGELHA